MPLKHIKLREEHRPLLNRARLKFQNDHPDERTTDELTVVTALHKYLEGDA